MKNFLFFFVKHRIKFLVILFGLLLGFSYYLTQIKITGSTDKFFIKNDPEYNLYKKVIKQFGSDNNVIVGIKGNDLFSYQKLSIIKQMIEDIKQIKGVIKVDSIFSKQDIVFRDGELHTNVFVDPDDIPKDKKVLEQVKKDAINNPLIYKNLVADNGNLLILNVVVDNNSDSYFNKYITLSVKNILDKYKSNFDGLLQFGSTYISSSIVDSIMYDVFYTIPFAILVIILTIYWSLKNVKLTLIPVSTSFLSIIAVLEFMGFTGIEFSILTAVVPALIVLIGTTEDAYLVSEFVEEKDKHKDDKDTIIKMISAKLGLPIILTSSTTIIGFASIYLNKIVMLQDFAIVATFGLFINFIITIILVPIFLHYFNINVTKKTTINYTTMLDFASNVFHKHTLKVYLLSGLVALLSIFFIPKIILDNNTLNYFKDSSEIKQRVNYLKQYIYGVQSFYIVVEAPKKKAFKEYHYLKELEKIENFIKSDKSKFNFSLSIFDNLALLNKEMMDGKGKFDIPNNRLAIAQYYTFFHRKDLKEYVDEKYQIAKIDVWHNIFSSNQFNKEKVKLEKFIKENIDPNLKITITGKNVLLNKAADTIVVGQTMSAFTTFVIVFILISLVFKSIRAGIVILMGNIIPIIVLFGVMGMFEIPLNVVTAVIATITFGIVVDDTIHLMMRYRYEQLNIEDKNQALENTIRGEGRAVLMTTISLIIGFLTLTTSDFVPVIEFAILSALVVFIAVLSDLFIVPSLIKNINILRKE